MQETFEIDVEADKIKELTVDELLSEELFSKIMSVTDSAERKFYESKCSVQAKRLHITKEFNACLSAFKYKVAAARNISNKGNKTNFTDQPLQLNCGDWICDVSGVRKNQLTSGGNYEAKFASPIPVLITEILENIYEGTEKIKITFCNNGWKSLICNRSTAASNTKIIDLADKGLEVNSDNSKMLVKYLADLTALNIDVIPRNKAVSKMGWTGNNEFMPYSDVKFDGENEYRHIYEAIISKGDFDKWISYTHELRKNKYLRLQMAASFAAPIIQKVGALSFILHFWGGSGNGKTVGLMVAMSVWGNPKIGELVRTMNMTHNALMATASFLNNIPFAGDELQTIKSSMGYDKLIMQCTENVGRNRMKYDSVQKMQTWNTAFIFTGEESCTRENSGGGVKNRVIEFECSEKVVEKGNDTVNFILNNYGFAGEKFVDCIADEDLKGQYAELLTELLENDTTEKQAMAMACMLLADKMACKYIYSDETPMSVDDVKEFLRTNKEVDVAERAYEFVCDLIALNSNKFENTCTGEIWGRIDDVYIYINKTVLIRKMRANNFEFDAVKRKWAEKGYLLKNSQGKMYHCTKCNGVKASYIKLLLHEDAVTEDAPPF